MPCQVVLDMMMELSESCYLGLFSQCSQQNVFEHAVTTVKDKLLEAGVGRNTC